MNEQLEQAALEKRNRIKSAAKTMYSVSVRYEHVLISASIERIRSGQVAIDLDRIKGIIEEFLNAGITDGSDFEDIINGLYDLLTVTYDDCDIRIVLLDTNTSFLVEKIFNTHRPLQQMAI